jgi:hypothetical protein
MAPQPNLRPAHSKIAVIPLPHGLELMRPRADRGGAAGAKIAGGGDPPLRGAAAAVVGLAVCACHVICGLLARFRACPSPLGAPTAPGLVGDSARGAGDEPEVCIWGLSSSSASV